MQIVYNRHLLHRKKAPPVANGGNILWVMPVRLGLEASVVVDFAFVLLGVVFVERCKVLEKRDSVRRLAWAVPFCTFV